MRATRAEVSGAETNNCKLEIRRRSSRAKGGISERLMEPREIKLVKGICCQRKEFKEGSTVCHGIQ